MLNAAIAMQPSPSDKSGTVYIFGIPALQPNLAPRPDRVDTIKIGRTNNVPRRKREWARKCSGQVQDWRIGWEVPFAAKFGASLCSHRGRGLIACPEKIIHMHYKTVESAWLVPEVCDACPTRHCEKFDEDLCGDWEAVVRVVEGYLRRLGWAVKR